MGPSKSCGFNEISSSLFAKCAGGGIRTHEPLRDGVLSPTPLTRLGDPRVFRTPTAEGCGLTVLRLRRLREGIITNRQGGGFEVSVGESVLDAIGNTPLVRLRRVSRGLKPKIYAKLEFMNPGGSVKDRIAAYLVADAEKRGLLKKGGTIIEPTSGNTGVGLAMLAAVRGYKAIFTMPDKVSEEKRALLRAYGAKLVVTPTDLPRPRPSTTSTWRGGSKGRRPTPSCRTSTRISRTRRRTSRRPALRSGVRPTGRDRRLGRGGGDWRDHLGSWEVPEAAQEDPARGRRGARGFHLRQPQARDKERGCTPTSSRESARTSSLGRTTRASSTR